MARALLVHWKPEEASEGLAVLKQAGHKVEVYSAKGGVGLSKFKSKLPEVVIVSLERLPSHGRELATWFRSTKATAAVPIIFVGGAEEKVIPARASFPDAVFCTWRGIRGAITKAIRTPQTATPSLVCSTKALWQKLEVREDDVILQLGGPNNLLQTLGSDLPTSVKLTKRPSKKVSLVLLFAERLQDMNQHFQKAVDHTPDKRAMWICWPKKTSTIPTDVTQAAVMAFARGSGWTDTKICRIDDDWSGHMFRRKRK